MKRREFITLIGARQPRGRSPRARSSGQGKSRGSGSWVSDPLLLGQIRWKLSGQGCAISATSRVRTSSLTSAGRKGSTSYLNWRPNWSTWTSTLSLRLLQPRLSPPDRRLRQSLSCSRNTLILSASGTWRGALEEQHHAPSLRSRSVVSLDHHVGAREHGWRNFETERFRGLKI